GHPSPPAPMTSALRKILVQAEVSFARIAHHCDHSRPRPELASHVARNSRVGAGRHADEEALFLGEAHLGFVGVAVVCVSKLINYFSLEGVWSEIVSVSLVCMGIGLTAGQGV